MQGKTGSTDLQTVIDQDEIIILGEVRHSDRIRAEGMNQSLQVLEDIFLPDYNWIINHVDLFDSEDGKWSINATAQGDYELGDFDPSKIETLTHSIEEDILKLRLNADPDDVMSKIQERALAETRKEIASKTRYDAEAMWVMHTSIVGERSDDTARPLDTRIRIGF